MKHFIPLVVAASILFVNPAYAQSSDGLIDQAKMEMKENNPTKALAILKKALEANPNNPELLILRGNAHTIQGDLAKAVTDYQLVIRLDPQNAEAHFMAGNIYYIQGSKENSSEKTTRGCEYFRKAKELGDKRAVSMLLKCP